MQKDINNKSNINNKIESMKTYNVSFKISQEIIYNKKIEYYTKMTTLLRFFMKTISEILKSINTNMMNMGMPNMMGMGMMNPPSLNMQFYYNGININYDDDKSTVEYYFKNDLNPIIFINYNNIDYYITILKFIFKDNHGNQFEIFDKIDMSINFLVKRFLLECGLNNKNDWLNGSEYQLTQWGIQLLYNNKNIEYEYIDNYGFKTDIKIGQYFNIDCTKIKNDIC